MLVHQRVNGSKCISRSKLLGPKSKLPSFPSASRRRLPSWGMRPRHWQRTLAVLPRWEEHAKPCWDGKRWDFKPWEFSFLSWKCSEKLRYLEEIQEHVEKTICFSRCAEVQSRKLTGNPYCLHKPLMMIFCDSKHHHSHISLFHHGLTRPCSSLSFSWSRTSKSAVWPCFHVYYLQNHWIAILNKASLLTHDCPSNLFLQHISVEPQ